MIWNLGVPYKLAWQVHRLAHADDPFPQMGNVPGPVAMERYLEASAKRGAPNVHVEAVRDAQRKYDNLAMVHEDSRGEFESIISGFAEDGVQQVDLTHKRAGSSRQ